jgi:DNA-binding CsgD family transcriptional regulator
MGLLPLARRASRSVGDLQPRRRVTEREAAVLHLVGGGLTSSQIAARLGITRPTVETHISAAMRKLGARNRHHAASLMDASPVT